MIKINLLPIRQTRKAEALRRETVLAGFVGALVFGGCLFVYAAQGISLSTVNSENAKLEQDITRLGEEARAVDEMAAKKDALERKLTVINDLRAKKTGPAHMLDELALAAPEKLQLTDVKEHGGAMDITGIAVTNEVVSEFLRALEASDYFDQVYLVNIETVDTKDANNTVPLKKFSLTARRVSPKAAKADAGKPAAETPAGSAPGAAPAGGTAPAGAEATPPAAAAAPPASTADVPSGAAPAAPAAPATGGTP